MLLEPLLDHPEHGGRPNTFAQHDLGRSYPDADGHDDGNEESTPVEESANTLIMAAAVVQRLPAAEAVRFARAHYPVLRRKVDRQLWTAARLADRTATRDLLVNGVYEFATGAAQRVPFTDWYVVATAAQRGFAARPVVGGAFALLLPPAASSTAWCRIQNRNSGKVLAVSGMSTADGARVTQ